MTYAHLKRLAVLDRKIKRRESDIESLLSEVERLRGEHQELDRSLTGADRLRILKRAQARVGRKIDEQEWIRSELEVLECET
jgi:hypothetical protein